MKNGEPNPDLYLIGTGVGGGLQLTIEAQRILDKVGRAYALHLPTPLRRHLRSLRVKTVDLSDRFADPRPLRDAYLDVTNFLLARVASERPVVVLTPGSPLFLNSIGRLLVLQGRRSGMQIRTIPGVSPLDALISYVGVDVAGFGLQVFTGHRLATTPTRLDPTIPLAVLELAGVGIVDTQTDAADQPARYAPLWGVLAAAYPPNHPATLVNVTGSNGRKSHATLPLRRFAEFVPSIRDNSHLFLDAARPQQRQPAQEV